MVAWSSLVVPRAAAARSRSSETGSGGKVSMFSTFTAANGDKLTTAITMQLCPIAPGIYHGAGTYVVTGGTGRFANATGSGVFDGTGNFGSGTIICALNGSISFN